MTIMSEPVNTAEGAHLRENRLNNGYSNMVIAHLEKLYQNLI